MSPISTTSRGSSIVAVIVILVALYIPVSSLDKYRWSGNFQIGTLSDTADTITLGKCAGSFLYARTTTASTTVTFCSNPGYNSQTPILWWSTYDTFQMTVTQPWLGESDASLTQNIHNDCISAGSNIVSQVTAEAAVNNWIGINVNNQPPASLTYLAHVKWDITGGAYVDLCRNTDSVAKGGTSYPSSVVSANVQCMRLFYMGSTFCDADQFYKNSSGTSFCSQWNVTTRVTALAGTTTVLTLVSLLLFFAPP